MKMSKVSKTFTIECPLGDYECPYYENGDCVMARMENGEDPRNQCDAFYGWDE